MQKKLVSIVIPCYNAEKYLEKCLNSLLHQTYEPIEVIIVDDGSTDNSVNVINQFIPKFKNRNNKLILISQANNGQAAAMNNALKYVSGEYLMWQDADDWYEIDAISNLVNYIEKNNLKIARGEVAYRNENNIEKIISYGRSKKPNNTDLFNSYIFETDSYCYSGIFICETKHLDKCISNRKIYESKAGQNWQLILPLTYNTKCGYLNKVVYNYRIVEKSHSHSVKKTKQQLKRCDEHKDILLTVLSSIKEISKFRYYLYKIQLDIKYLKKKVKILLSKSFLYIIVKKLKGHKNERID